MYQLHHSTHVCPLHEWSLWSVQYLYRVSQQFEIPQQDKIVNVFTLLNFPNLKQNHKWIIPFITVGYSSSFCLNLEDELILMRVCHWLFSFFPEGSLRSIPGFSPSWRSTRGEDSEGQTDCWFCSKTSREPADYSDPPTLQSPSAGSPSGYRQETGDTFEDKARTWSSWICTQKSFFTQSMIPTHKY